MEYSFGSSQHFAEDLEAQQFHAAGLRARSAGDFREAETAFQDGARRLRETDATVERGVQSARLYRDWGETAMQEAVVSQSTIPLADAQGYLDLARRQLGYLERDGGLYMQGETDWHRERFATHARTLSLTGRLATLRAVMFDRNTSGTSDDARYERRVPQRPYGEAHRLFLRGNDGSGLVEHALLGARQERLNGQRLHMLPWLKRAAAGLIWTRRHDPEDLPNAWDAVDRHWHSLQSYEAAREGVLTNP